MILAVPEAPAVVAWYERALGATALRSLGSIGGPIMAGVLFFVRNRLPLGRFP